MRAKSVLLAIAAGLALADASIVTLALPEILTALNTTIEGVAAVIGVYTIVLCVTLLPAWWLAQRAGYRAVGVGGFLVFALASALCSRANTLDRPADRAWRSQAIGGAAALVAAFALLHAGERPQRQLWLGRRARQHGDRAGARRRADPGLHVAGDLHRAGATGADRDGRLPARSAGTGGAGDDEARTRRAAGRPSRWRACRRR